MNPMAIKMFQNKKFKMRRIPFFASAVLMLILSSCGKATDSFSPVNSESFPEKQIKILFHHEQSSMADSLVNNQLPGLTPEQGGLVKQVDGLISMTEEVSKQGTDSLWVNLAKKWVKLNAVNFGAEREPFQLKNSPDESPNGKIFPELISKWAELNAGLVKLSGEVRFGDALEKMVYGPENKFISEKLLKSIIFTHVFDQIFVNVIGSSSMVYRHTTGGEVKIIQETNYPEGNEMTLKVECSDFRYMDVFIRIPSWAVNPTVTHGNVKYVARPGEYCQISRKWKTGDEIRVALKN